ncbi:potassium channel family protein [Hyalangium rubrum]|uniref:TrkA family potassium uptake protein n=1 Tax=Hyalangium rubrum TaxID=3103134 RepID=A0ABU5GY63_9BACT|nr:TrkA family potassium uptake protein [Hyalangium sp. s54d21]MDY7225477.1 TrkA family potassium uptake protein [Hyalangium sp. s54d21]
MKTYVVVGLGQFGECVARELSQAGHEVLAVDRSMERVEALKDVVAQAMRADCTSEEAMRALGASKAEVAVVSLGEEDFEAAVLGTAVLKALGIKTVVARSSSPQRGRILSLAGASRVVYPEAEMGEQLARMLMHTNLLASTELPSGYALAELRVPEHAAGKSLQELRLRQTHGLNVIAIHHRGLLNEPIPEAMLNGGDVLLVAGKAERVAALARLWEPKS